jgi:hypothetical protein
MTRKAIEATKDDVFFATLEGSKRALLLLVASRGASDARTLAQEEEATAADIDAETILTQADEALVLG